MYFIGSGTLLSSAIDYSLGAGLKVDGVTLHQLLPGRKVDSGPVVAQMEFELVPDDTFATVLEKSIGACPQIFEANVRDVASGSYGTFAVETAGSAFTFNDVARLCADAHPDCLARATVLGDYAGFFPALSNAVGRERR